MSSTAQGGSMPRFSVGDEIELRVRVTGYDGMDDTLYLAEVVGAGDERWFTIEQLCAGKAVERALQVGDIVDERDLINDPSSARGTVVALHKGRAWVEFNGDDEANAFGAVYDLDEIAQVPA